MNIIAENWDRILDTVKKEHELTSVSFDTWLKPLKVYHVEGNLLKIVLPEQMGMDFKKYIDQKYTLPLKVAVGEITGQSYDIEYILSDEARSNEAAGRKAGTERGDLSHKYTFDTFVVGSNNRFAHSASLAVAESPGVVYNPLFLYGGVGLGKTHLMHSIAHYILSKYPEKRVLYVTSEYFTNELIEAIRNGNNTAMAKFREKYRNIDVLLIDDVQFIIGKESTQEEFFHTFNDLHSSKKQIVLSSDKPPKDYETLEDRLRSRFEWGLIADIQSPDYETRMAILQKKEELDGHVFDQEILEYIATNITSNIRELEGALNKLIAYSTLEHVEITMEIAEKELQDIIFPDKPKVITPELILNVVAEHFHTSPTEITSRKKTAEIVRPRQIAMYLCHTMTDLPLQNIANALGKKDHTTIIHGSNKISEEIKSNETMKNLVETIMKKINPN